MSRVATVFLVLVAMAAVVLAIIFLRGGSAAKSVGGALFEFGPEDIRGITISNGDDRFEIRRSDRGWQISPEPDDRASAEMVARLLEIARSTVVLDRVPASEIHDSDQLAEFGVRKSRVTLDFRGDGDHPLLFGKDGADESRIYVRFEESDDVYLVNDDLYRAVSTPPADFRDRRLTLLRPERIERFIIRQPMGELEVRREASGWRIVRPMNAPANPAAVEDFLSKVVRLQAEGFVGSGRAEAPETGLAEPRLEVRLFAEGEREPETLSIGEPAGEGLWFARYDPRGVVFRMPDAARSLLTTEFAKFRDPALSRINLDVIDKIRIVTNGRTLELTRSGEAWTATVGDLTASASAVAVDRLVAALAETAATRMEDAGEARLDANGLRTPPSRIAFLSVVSENTPEAPAGEQLVQEIAFSAPREDATVAVHVSGSPEIAFAPATILELLSADPAAWSSP
ncbi:MAG: DUF4340 domain-containing protein [Terrimicrobiaceae bacterium]|nr:DUF4340 domain-containing protein [Terrimicrobiaceae bacterium]